MVICLQKPYEEAYCKHHEKHALRQKPYPVAFSYNAFCNCRFTSQSTKTLSLSTHLSQLQKTEKYNVANGKKTSTKLRNEISSLLFGGKWTLPCQKIHRNKAEIF